MRRRGFTAACVLALLLLLAGPARALDEPLREAFDLSGVEQAVPPEAQQALDGAGVDDADGDGLLQRLLLYAQQQLGAIFRRAVRSMVLILGVVLLCSMAGTLCTSEAAAQYIPLAGTLAVAAAAAGDLTSFLRIGPQTLQTLSDYSRALLPCMASAAAVAGSGGAAAAKYAATALFMELLLSAAGWLVMPLVWAHIACVAANAALGTDTLSSAASLTRWGARTAMTALVIAFTAYLSVTGVISGAADALTVRMTKTAVSAALPVVGSIVSDAASAVAAGAGMVRGTVGVFGLLVVLAVCIVPFLDLGLRYLLYKAVAGLSLPLCDKRLSGLISGIGSAFGMVLALTGCGAFFLYFSILSCMGAMTA